VGSKEPAGESDYNASDCQGEGGSFSFLIDLKTLNVNAI
jgi:hypothetical protein